MISIHDVTRNDSKTPTIELVTSSVLSLWHHLYWFCDIVSIDSVTSLVLILWHHMQWFCNIICNDSVMSPALILWRHLHWICNGILIDSVMPSGLNFINILLVAFYTRRSRKCKISVKLSVSFYIFGKAAQKNVDKIDTCNDLICDVTVVNCVTSSIFSDSGRDFERVHLLSGREGRPLGFFRGPGQVLRLRWVHSYSR